MAYKVMTEYQYELLLQHGSPLASEALQVGDEYVIPVKEREVDAATANFIGSLRTIED